jgi:hypothetical protein
MTSVHKSKAKCEPVPPTAEALAHQRQKNQMAIRLLREWMADECGYDERVGPIVEEALKENRFALRDPADD